MKQSPAGTLNRADFERWGQNLVVFLLPVLFIYITSIVTFINMHNGVFALSYFVPTPITLGAMMLYVLNGLLDLLRKAVSGPMPPTQPTA